tara:strand:+ start:36 stop:203 length:168 start_codon:yes stop_codon:yes gene_type:complete
MAKKVIKEDGQFNHYKKWTTDMGYTFLAKDLADAKSYLKAMGHLGYLTTMRVVDV